MALHKERLTVTIDPDLIAAGSAAVAEGRASSLSAWVNDALVACSGRERRLRAMAEAVNAYEAKFGILTRDELESQRLSDAEAAHEAT
jgi:hypothetical protein